MIVVVQGRRLGRLRRRLDALTRDADGQSLSGVLEAHLDRVAAVARDVDELAARAAVQEGVGRRSIQRVGIVRYNPFEDTGGNQSFALALLDGSGSGVVVSSLHSRTGTRVYAKSVAEGRSDGALSDEETQALQRALSSTGSAGSLGSPSRDRSAGRR